MPQEALLGIPPCAPAGRAQPELPQQSPACAHPVLQPLQGVKEFKCEVCGREFTLQANMKRHMLIHTSVRPYQCHICFKTFVQKQTLKTHMIVHSPVKPFKCKVRRGGRPGAAPRSWRGASQDWAEPAAKRTQFCDASLCSHGQTARPALPLPEPCL